VLFCIGSQHPVTAAQLENLKRERCIREFDVTSAVPAEIAAALAAGKHAVLRVDVDEAERRRIRDLLSGVADLMEAAVISGGDTLTLFGYAMQCESIEIEGQVVTGLPWGILRGGPLDGLAVATKSGAFGAPGDLIEVTDFFTCSRN
jgi:uncharacterized protein YgbK (DUF1537 family)